MCAKGWRERNWREDPNQHPAASVACPGSGSLGRLATALTLRETWDTRASLTRGPFPPRRALGSGSSVVGRLDRAGVPRLRRLERRLPGPEPRLFCGLGRSSEPERHQLGRRNRPVLARPGHRHRHQLGPPHGPGRGQLLEQQPERGAARRLRYCVGGGGFGLGRLLGLGAAYGWLHLCEEVPDSRTPRSLGTQPALEPHSSGSLPQN